MDKKERVEKINLGSVREEIVWLKNLLKQTASPIVFAHNDLFERQHIVPRGRQQSGVCRLRVRWMELPRV